MKIRAAYAISCGSYSDYRVLAVAEDEPTAEAWAKALRDEPDGWNQDAGVEEMLLIPAGMAPEKQHRVDLSEDWWDDGRAAGPRINESDEHVIGSLYGEAPLRPSVRFVRAPCHNGLGGRIEIRGRTLNAVMKVYSEHKARWTAEPRAFAEINR